MSSSDVILPHKKFTWIDFWGVYTHIPPVATPLILWADCNLFMHLEAYCTFYLIHFSSDDTSSTALFASWFLLLKYDSWQNELECYL